MTGWDQKKQNFFDDAPASGKFVENQPMHPDDFYAQLAWVMAKRENSALLPIPEQEP